MRALAIQLGSLVAFCGASCATELDRVAVSWAGALPGASFATPVKMTPANTKPVNTTLTKVTLPVETGLASFSGEGGRTASGEYFDPRKLTTAHRSLPFGTMLRVTNKRTAQSVTVRVNDRGPSVSTRILCLSLRAAQVIGIDKAGVAPVSMEILSVPGRALPVASNAR